MPANPGILPLLDLVEREVRKVKRVVVLLGRGKRGLAPDVDASLLVVDVEILSFFELRDLISFGET